MATQRSDVTQILKPPPSIMLFRRSSHHYSSSRRRSRSRPRIQISSNRRCRRSSSLISLLTIFSKLLHDLSLSPLLVFTFLCLFFFFFFFHRNCVVLGRTVSLLSILSSFISYKTIDGAYASAGYLISVMQTAAVLEVLHGAIGIVPSGFLSPLMQWSGRTHFILAIVGQIREVQDSPWLSITLAAWSLGEMIRYPHYAFTCLGRCPYWLTYLRYTGFIMIYPTGLVGELLIMYKALPYVKERNLYANFFSVFPFSYYDFLWAVLLVYPFLWLKLYLQLFKQRKSKLGKPQKHQSKRKRI